MLKSARPEAVAQDSARFPPTAWVIASQVIAPHPLWPISSDPDWIFFSPSQRLPDNGAVTLVGQPEVMRREIVTPSGWKDRADAAAHAPEHARGDGQDYSPDHAPGGLADQISRVLKDSPGSPPPPADRDVVEARTNTKVDAVVHEGPAVDRVLRGWSARGAAVGRHLLMPAGAYADVLRHELTHVAQTGNRDVDLTRGVSLGSPQAPEERSTGDRPASVSDPQVVRRRFDMYEGPEERRERWMRAAEARRRAEERTAAWHASAASQSGGDLASMGTSLREDIDASYFAVVGARQRVLDKAAADLPAGLSTDMAAAAAGVELISGILGPDRTANVPPDLQNLVRDRLNAFYWGLRSWETKRYRYAVRFAHDQLMVWKMSQMPIAGSRFADRRPPPDTEPPRPPTAELTNRRTRAQAAADAAQWSTVVDDFARSTTLVDDWAMRMAAEGAPEVQALQQAIGMHKRQVSLAARHPMAIKIPAVFYVRDERESDDLPMGAKSSPPAVGHPWFFYLYQEGANWVLEDLTAADKRVNIEEPTLAEAIEIVLRTTHGQDQRKDPPERLWQQLNSRLRFPKGELHLKLPSGNVYVLETTASRSLSDYLGFAAIALGLISLTLLTAGAGTAAGVAAIAAAGVGIAGTVAGLAELREHGMATKSDWARAGLMIAVDLAGAMTIGLGKIASSAGKAGEFASDGARLAGRLYAPIARLSAALDITQLFVMTDTFVEQYVAIGSQAGLSKDERYQARRRLVLMGLASGALSVWAIRRTIKDIRERSIRTDELLPGQWMPGRPVAGPPAPPSVPAADYRLGRARVNTDPQLVDTLAPGTITIQLHRNKVGLISEIGIVHGPRPKASSAHVWAADLAHHQQIAVYAQRYSGLIGEIRELMERLGAKLAGRPHGPIQAQLDLAKLENRVLDRLRRLENGRGLTEVEIKGYERDIESFANQIEDHRRAIARGDAATGTISQLGTPDGHPLAPPGYSYHFDTAAQRWVVVAGPGSGPRLHVELDPSTGLPTGRFSNLDQLESLHINGLDAQNPATIERLRSLGYAVEPGTSVIRPHDLVAGDVVQSMAPLRVVDGKVQIAPRIHLDAKTLGTSTAYRKFYGGRLDANEMAVQHRGMNSETAWVEVGAAIVRGGDERLLYAGSVYKLVKYIRYHIIGPGTGSERTRIFLAPEAANQFANLQIEDFMRRLHRVGGPQQKIFFKVRYATFDGSELRSFIDGMLTSGDQKLLRVLARHGGKFERVLKSAAYEIRVVDKNGQETLYRASITIGPPGMGQLQTQAPTLVLTPGG
ncbi:DUF4157 domain-containing protein [Streptomyces sp. NPDC047525]|uniref:eCIS core domain-containing protein n=1 Tax=Streptomyces sp. NPDC047525 TaxID=3155264 RepID=UPI003407E701